MSPSEPPDNRPLETIAQVRRELDGLVVNIELTLTSIIQGVALYFLTDNARGLLSALQFEYWIYIANGLLIIFLFWSRSVVHTLTVIRWPIEFSHNFLYIACTLFEAVTFTKLNDPLQWYSFNAIFAFAVWVLFVVDKKMIEFRRLEAISAEEAQLHRLIGSDQDWNIRLLVPLFILYPMIVAICIWIWPLALLQRHMHVVAGGIQFVALIGYLIYVIRFFGHLSPLILLGRSKVE
jgi:hypothetical protein